MLTMVDYYNYAAMFQYQNHDTAQAISYFEKYLKFPNNVVFTKHESDSIFAAKKSAYSQTALNLASLNYNKKNWPKAIEFADIALQDTIGTRDLYIIKMQAYAAQGDSAQWLSTLKEAVSKTENEGFAQNLLYYYVSHNDVQGAEAMANDMAVATPNSKMAWYMKGCVELNLKKDYAEARKCLKTPWPLILSLSTPTSILLIPTSIRPFQTKWQESTSSWEQTR